MPTRNILRPYGPTNTGEIYLTMLKLTAKKMFVKRTAIWAFVFVCRLVVLLTAGKDKRETGIYIFSNNE